MKQLPISHSTEKSNQEQPDSNSCMQENSKGYWMEKIFSKEERANIDAAVPLGEVPADQTFYYVMDYNHSVLGRLVDLRVEAKKRNIVMPF